MAQFHYKHYGREYKENPKHFFKKYILPSAITGPVMAAGIRLLTKNRDEPFLSKGLLKGIGIAIPTDILSGLAIGGWAQHQDTINNNNITNGPNNTK